MTNVEQTAGSDRPPRQGSLGQTDVPKSRADVMSHEGGEEGGVSRREILRWGAIAGLGAGVAAVQGVGVPMLHQKGLLSPDGAFGATSTALGDLLFYTEVFPISPLILNPFSDELPIPAAAKPIAASEYTNWARPPGPGPGQQNSLGNKEGQHGIAPGNEAHQLWPTDPKVGYPDPLVYKIDVLTRAHSFTTSKVMPIDDHGKPTVSFDETGKAYPAGMARNLPASTIYGFNGTFPGPRINAEYGKACLVRFENHLDENPLGLDRGDFGTKDLSFLTHLHNAH